MPFFLYYLQLLDGCLDAADIMRTLRSSNGKPRHECNACGQTFLNVFNFREHCEKRACYTSKTGQFKNVKISLHEPQIEYPPVQPISPKEHVIPLVQDARHEGIKLKG